MTPTVAESGPLAAHVADLRHGRRVYPGAV